MDYVLPAFAGVIALASVLLAPRAESESALALDELKALPNFQLAVSR